MTLPGSTEARDNRGDLRPCTFGEAHELVDVEGVVGEDHEVLKWSASVPV